jgi:hypothetical protein
MSMVEDDNSTLSNLGGEMAPGSWDFVAPHGPLPNPVGHVCPIMSHDCAGDWRMIGTGFHIGPRGLFVTAKHVIEDVFENCRIVAGKQLAPLAVLQMYSDSGLFGPDGYAMRPITHVWVGNQADIALGIAAQMVKKNTGEQMPDPRILRLSWNVPKVGDDVQTFAFPNAKFVAGATTQTFNCRPDAYGGKVEQVGDFRDRVKMPFPYIQANFVMHGAASGGPVFGDDGGVVGVNSTYVPPDGPSFIAQIRCLQDAFVERVMLSGAAPHVTFAELVTAHLIDSPNFIASAIPHQLGMFIALDDVAITAPPPALHIELYG